MLGLSPIFQLLKVNLFKPFTWKIMFNSFRNCKRLKNEIRTLKSYSKDPSPHNIILYELDFDVKFPLLRLFQFLSDLKSTICLFLKTLFYYLSLYRRPFTRLLLQSKHVINSKYGSCFKGSKQKGVTPYIKMKALLFIFIC